MKRGRWSILAAVLVAGIWSHCAPQVDIHGLFAKASSSNPRIAAEAQAKINQLILERRVDLFQAVLDNSDDDLRGLALIFLGRIGTDIEEHGLERVAEVVVLRRVEDGSLGD